MSILVQNVSMQQLKHEFESFLKRFYRKLLVLQPEKYIISNTGRERLIRSHSSARFSFELSGNSN